MLTCLLAYPRYSAGVHGDDPVGLAKVEPFWRELEGHAALVIDGHDHTQRFERIRGIV